MAMVANVTITSDLLGSTKAIASIATPVTQFEVINVFFLPQYFSIKMQTKVPGNLASY
jgi:hypothetical protein